MQTIIIFLVHLIASVARIAGRGGVKALIAENLVLRQQLIVINRTRHRSPNLSAADRFLFGICTLILIHARIAKTAIIFRPSTLHRLHEQLIRRKYRDLFSSKKSRKPGPRGPTKEVIRLIIEIKRRNPQYGCPRIAFMVLNTFGISIDKDVVRRVLAKHYLPDLTGTDGPSWLTFLGNARDSLWSIDLFRCESILLKSHWVLVVMDQYTRRIVGFAVQLGDVDGERLCRMFSSVIAGSNSPNYMSSDNDPLFEYYRWKANLRILEIKTVKTVPYIPISHPFVERLIGTIRREYLDHVFYWNAQDLERKLECFKSYYNRHRVHSALNGNVPEYYREHANDRRESVINIKWRSHLNGLYQTPMAA